MSTANKLTYLNDTKGLLKQKINNLGGDITDNTTFRNYANQLQNVYDNLPKTEFAEGSNITLSNTLKGKLDYEDDKIGYGDTTQGSTQGYQLIPYTLATLKTLNTGGTWNDNVYTFAGVTYTVETENGYIKEIKTTGTATANTFMFFINTLTITAGTYYVSGCPNGGSVSTYFIYAGSGLNHNTSDTPTATILNEDVSLTSNNLRITIINGTNVNNLIWKPMLSKTNTTTFEPYTNGAAPNPSYPFPVKTVTGEQDITIRGKNKLKINDVTLTSNGVTLTVKDNYFILNGTNNGTESVFQLSNYITPFKTNANTKLKAFQISGTASGSLTNTFFRTYSNWTNQVNVNFTQTTISSYSAELTYNNCMLALAGGTYTDYKIGIMVADNLTSDDTFENYITPITKTLNLGNIELAEIGTYRDDIWTDRETGKWYKHSEIDKIASYNGETISTTYMSTTGQLTTGATVYYGKNSTDTEITDTTLLEQLEDIYNIMSLNGTTIIEINGTLPMIIKARALKGE